MPSSIRIIPLPKWYRPSLPPGVADLASVSQASFSWIDTESFTKNNRLISVTAQGKIEWRIGEMVWQQYDLRGQTDDFDLVLEISHGLENDVVHLQYNEDLFARKTVEGMADHYLSLLSAMAAMADMAEVPVSKLPLMRPVERSLILDEWSNCRQAATRIQRSHSRIRGGFDHAGDVTV